MASQGGCLSAVTVVFKNPQLGKVIVASGLQAAASSVAITFVTANLKAKYWGQDLSSIQARYSMAMAIVGIIGGSLYGRFSDSIDRRLAAGIYGLLTFFPAWTYLVLGLSHTALTVSTILGVVGCVGVGSNTLLVLAQDLAEPEEREAAFGAFFMWNSAITFVCMSIPILLILVLKVVPSNPYVSLGYQVLLSAGFFLCLAFVKMPARSDEEPKASSAENGEGGRERQEQPSACSSLVRALWMPVRNLVEPIILGCGHPVILAACFAAGLQAFSGDLVFDVGGQYFQDCLGILPPQKGAAGRRADEIFSVITMLPPQLGSIPGYALVGWAMKRLGCRRLLQMLIPVSTLLTCTGALFQFMADDVSLMILVVLLDYASLANVPLLAWVKEAAPSDRVGEAIGAVGSCQQIANFVGNFVISFLNPWVLRTLGTRGFWVYYPACGLLSLLALVPVWLVKVPASEVGGKAADSKSSNEESSDDSTELGSSVDVA